MSLPDFSHQQYLLRFGDGELSLWHHPCHHRFRGQAKPGDFLRDFFGNSKLGSKEPRFGSKEPRFGSKEPRFGSKEPSLRIGKEPDFAWHIFFKTTKKGSVENRLLCFFLKQFLKCGREVAFFFCCGRVQLPMGAGEAGNVMRS